MQELKNDTDIVVVLNGDDSAFYKSSTISKVIDTHNKKNSVITFVTLEPDDPTGLGRVIKKDGKVIKVIEEKDANEAEKKIKEVNDGLYVFDKNWLETNIKQIQKSETQKKVRGFKQKDPKDITAVQDTMILGKKS